MQKILKKSLLLAAIIGLTSSLAFSQMLPIFSVSQNDLPEEVVAQLSTEIAKVKVATLSLAKNNRDKDVYLVAFSSAIDTRIIIINEQTRNYIVITPVNTRLTEFQLSTFLIEELRQGALGDADRFLIVATTPDYSITNVAAVSTANGEVYIPRYYYGEKENIQEALPKDRIIVSIAKGKPRLMSAAPDDPEVQQRIEKLAEEMSYYVYRLKLPDGTSCIYDENFNPE